MPANVLARHPAVQSRSVLDLVGNTPLLSFKRLANAVAPRSHMHFSHKSGQSIAQAAH